MLPDFVYPGAIFMSKKEVFCQFKNGIEKIVKLTVDIYCREKITVIK